VENSAGQEAAWIGVKLKMEHYPRVTHVEPLPDKRLRVTFATGNTKLYDCTPLMDDPAFAALKEDCFFNNVHADAHGYGAVWNDNVDLSESELWIHGIAESGTP
jgi:hypothetical protein